MKKIITAFIFITGLSNFFSQQSNSIFAKCNIGFNGNSNHQYAIDVTELKCLSKTSDKQILVFVFEWWCKPCNEKINKVKEFAEDNNLDLVVLTLDSQQSKDSKKDEDVLVNKYKINNIAVLSDSYGKTMRKKYNKFLTEVYDNQKFTDDLSKLIIYDKIGNIKYVSTWEDWDKGQDALQEKILPLIEK